MGRFMSPDWSDENDPIPYANLRNPQSLNLYSYVHNNPLRQADPDGHDGEDDEDEGCCTVAPAPVQTPTASDWGLTEEAGASILGDVGEMFAGAIAVPFALTTTMNEGPNDDCHLWAHGAKKNDDQEHTKNARPSTKGKRVLASVVPEAAGHEGMAELDAGVDGDDGFPAGRRDRASPERGRQVGLPADERAREGLHHAVDVDDRNSS